MNARPERKREWIGIRFGSDYHVMPDDDLIEHEPDECVCVPDRHWEIAFGPGVSVYTHHSLDGRERYEKDAN